MKEELKRYSGLALSLEKSNLYAVLQQSLNKVFSNEKDLLLYELGKIVGTFEKEAEILQQSAVYCYAECKKYSSVLIPDEHSLIKIKPEEYFNSKIKLVNEMLNLLVSMENEQLRFDF